MVMHNIRNGYYLAAGMLALLFAFTHAWNGHATVLTSLHIGELTIDTRTIFTYVWHIITVENLVFGIAFILMSLYRDPSKVRFVAWLIVILLIARLLVILGVTVWFDAAAFTDTLVDSAAIIIYAILILLGARNKTAQ
ncbi:hypothetical protein [Paenibacillus sp. 1P07SE]|uniref:hypothetical protein n=1 Tax=Paenibacillus sp. 1P07SE TaxID=3132209 RepID=UPI0039A407AE